MDRVAKFGPHLKAIVSALVSGAIAFLTALLTALQGEHSGFETITDGQWVTAALAFLVALGINGGVTYQRAATDRCRRTGAAVRPTPPRPPPRCEPDSRCRRRVDGCRAHRMRDSGWARRQGDRCSRSSSSCCCCSAGR